MFGKVGRQVRGPLKNSGTPAAAHPRRLAPPATLTCQRHASLSRAARGIHGCTTSVGPTILQRTPRRSLMAYTVSVTWIAKDGEEDAVATALEQLVEPSRAEPGVIHYIPHRDPD